ncbi:MAG: hypothetical protein ABI488_18580 [Polyangiaceae bacterium]
MTGEDFNFRRLSKTGNELEQELIDSAREDVPSAALRQAAFERLLADDRARRRRYLKGGLTLSATVLGLAAAFVLFPRRVTRPMQVSPESRASTLAVTRGSPDGGPLEGIPAGSAPPPSAESRFAACSPAAVAEGRSPLIDDFEDGNTHLPMIEHRAGEWLTYGDATAKQAPMPGSPFMAMRIPGGRGESRYALHHTGEKFTKWGANLSVTFNPRHCYDASVYDGIQFWARGHGQIRVAVKVTQVVSEEFGGSCTNNCFDTHAVTIKLSREFEHFVVRWSELTQTGFGEAVKFNPHSLDGLEFAVRPDQTPFDFWVDDVSFLAH